MELRALQVIDMLCESMEGCSTWQLNGTLSKLPDIEWIQTFNDRNFGNQYVKFLNEDHNSGHIYFPVNGYFIECSFEL